MLSEKLRESEKNVKLLTKENEDLINLLKNIYRCSGERNHLSKPILDEIKIKIN